MKVTFSLTLNEVNCHDETTAKEMLASFLSGGLNVRVDDITILSMEADDFYGDDDEGIECARHESHYHEPDADFNPEEQMKHMED